MSRGVRKAKPLVRLAGRVGYAMFALEPASEDAKKLMVRLFPDAAWSDDRTMLVDHRYVDGALAAVRAHGGRTS